MLDLSTFDKILLHKDINQYIVANTFLHVLSNDPVFLEKYNLSVREKIWQSFRLKIVTVVRIVQTIFDKKIYSTRLNNNKSNVLFVSHLTNMKQILREDDAYFGDLPNQLLKNNISSSIVLVNHARVNRRKFLDSWAESKIPRYILGASLGFSSEIKLYLVQRKSKKHLKSILRSLKIDKKTTKDILYNHMSASTFEALRLAKQIVDIAQTIDAKFIITTYEGHSWERLVFYYARKLNPSIKCFGYQHAAVFEHQHAIKRQLNSQYNPDIILTSGKISHRILSESELLKCIRINCLGSPKHTNVKLLKDKVNCCLVVPQGSVFESLLLFELSFLYAKNNKNQKFIWRLHPLLSFNKLKKHSSIFEELPNNIYLSEGDLDEDVQKSDSVLYRGSTAVINAISRGLKPIYYLQSNDEVSVDPIYQQQKGKKFVINQEQFKVALNEDIDIEDRQSLQNFAHDFYTPFDVEVLTNEIL